nr:hypothetical protein [Prevotella sp.]
MAIFFSDNPAVGLSYQYVYANNLYNRMLGDIDSLLGTNTPDGKGGIDLGRFESIDGFYERLN